MAKQFVNKENAKGRGTYESVISRIIKDKVCPFCEKNFLNYHTRPILKRGAHWIVTENMNPYEGTSHHILFVHRRHVETPTDMSADAWKELLSHVQYIVKKRKLPAGGFYMRFGDTRYSGASVSHLHANLLIGGSNGKNKEPILAVLGYKKKSPRS